MLIWLQLCPLAGHGGFRNAQPASPPVLAEFYYYQLLGWDVTDSQDHYAVISDGSTSIRFGRVDGYQDAFYDMPVGSLPAGTGKTMRFTGTTILKVENGLITAE